MENKNPMRDMKQESKSNRFMPQGVFSVVICLMLLCTLIFLNLAAGRLPSKYTEIDVSATRLYELSDQTREVAARVDRDITIYWIVQSGKENSEIGTLISRYLDLNPHLKSETVDPIVNPDFTDRYTSEIILDNSLIVADETRSRYISYDDIFSRSYNYQTQDSSTVLFDGEKQLTSAIDYVNEGNAPKLGRVTGHGESVLSVAFEEALGHQNYILENLNTLSLEEIPSDIDCLLIVGPTSDLSQKEGDAVASYLDNGGKMLVFTDYGHTDLPVLKSLLEHYGVEMYEGLVLEADSNMCYGNYPMQLLPGILFHDITAPITRSGYLVLVPMAHGMKLPEIPPANVSVKGLLMTSGGAYAKEGNITTVSRTEGDTAGPFVLGIAAEEQLKDAKNRTVWFSTSQIINKEYDAIVNGVNTDLVLNALGWLTENENSITIRSKQISGTKLTIPAAAITRLGIIMAGVIPLAVLLTGLAITWKRRRK